VQVDAPSIDDTILILKGIRHKYEEHHKAVFTDKALEAAAKLSERYITARFLPDKAIDIMDEAGSKARIASLVRPPDIESLTTEIEEVCAKKEEAISKQHFEEAAKYRDEEKQLRQKQETVLEEWKTSREENRITVDEDDMMRVVADWTGIPLTRLEKKETERLLQLGTELQETVIGQTEACLTIARALRRSRADLKDPNRPIGAFMFLGPTGVGKTFLAQTLAEKMFGDKDSIIQVDMSEYMEKFSVSRMIGSPPGYVGHEEGGQLSEQVRRKPYSVVLFDEIEKAHPDVVQIMLQIFEEGRLTDSLGRVIDFRNTIIIMTTNVGAAAIQRQTKLGFGAAKAAINDYESIKENVMDEAKKVFKPEFLNRISDLIVFHGLTRDDLVKIVDLEISKVQKRLVDKKIAIELNADAKDLIIDHGYDEKYGARPLRRSIETLLEDPLSEALLSGEINEEDSVLVNRNDEALVFELVEKAEATPSESES